MANTSILALAALGAFVLYTVSQYVKSRNHASKYKLPPLVPGVPLFGNTFDIPLVQQGPWAKKLAEKYGEM